MRMPVDMPPHSCTTARFSLEKKAFLDLFTSRSLVPHFIPDNFLLLFHVLWLIRLRWTMASHASPGALQLEPGMILSW